jgi:putative ABC transport system substrate-binding protein
VKRRAFIAGLGSAAAWPVVARGQQRALPVVGFLHDQSADDSKNVTVPFLRGLKETGYVEDQNVAVEYRYAENQLDRLPALAADLVRRRVAVIVATGATAAVPAKAATATIPIVFITSVDPVAWGLVASLNRPGANVTGTALLGAELAHAREAADEFLALSKTAAMPFLATPCHEADHDLVLCKVLDDADLLNGGTPHFKAWFISKKRPL